MAADVKRNEFTAYDLSGQGHTIPLPSADEGRGLKMNIIAGSAMLLPGDQQAVLICDGETIDDYSELLEHITGDRRIDILVEDKDFSPELKVHNLLHLDTLLWLRNMHMIRLDDLFTSKRGCCLLQCNYMLVGGKYKVNHIEMMYHLFLDVFEIDPSFKDYIFIGAVDFVMGNDCLLCQDKGGRIMCGRHGSWLVFSNILELKNVDIANRYLSILSTRSTSLNNTQFICVLIKFFAFLCSKPTPNIEFLIRLIEYADDRKIHPSSLHMQSNASVSRGKSIILSDPDCDPKIRNFIEQISDNYD